MILSQDVSTLMIEISAYMTIRTFQMTQFLFLKEKFKIPRPLWAVTRAETQMKHQVHFPGQSTVLTILWIHSKNLMNMHGFTLILM